MLLPLSLPTATDLQGDWSCEVRRRLDADLARIATVYLKASEQGEAESASSFVGGLSAH